MNTSTIELSQEQMREKVLAAAEEAVEKNDFEIFKKVRYEECVGFNEGGNGICLATVVHMQIQQQQFTVCCKIDNRKCEIKGGILHLTTAEIACLKYAYEQYKNGVVGLFGTKKIGVQFLDDCTVKIKRANKKEYYHYNYRFL